MRPTSRCWRPGRKWRRQAAAAAAAWPTRTWPSLIKLWVQTLRERERRREPWRNPTPARLWRWRWLLPPSSKSDATFQRDGRIAGPSYPGGIKNPEATRLFWDSYFSLWRGWTSCILFLHSRALLWSKPQGISLLFAQDGDRWFICRMTQNIWTLFILFCCKLWFL